MVVTRKGGARLEAQTWGVDPDLGQGLTRIDKLTLQRDTLETVQQRAMNVIEGQQGQDLFPEERLRDLGLFSLEKRRAGRILPNISKYQKGLCKQD